MRKCARCCEAKSLGDFYKCASRNDGLQAYCKDCSKKTLAVWVKENPEIVKARPKKKYIYAERARQWHIKNYAANKEKILARNKAWAKANPEAVRRLSLEGTNRRNARMKGAVGSHTHIQWVVLMNKFGWRCACCKQPKKLTKDHIVPLVAGGSDYIENIQPLCRECNSSKREQTIDYRDAHINFV